jgi:peptidoglycan hydrolase-like protein with peptidoglycan-binding domain
MGLIILYAIVASAPAPSYAQGPAEGIFSGVKALYAAAQAKPEEDRLNDYLGIRRLLDLIVTEHPSSDLAVSILLQDTIDGVDVAAIDAAIQPSKNEIESTASSDTETANTSGEANSAVSPSTSQVAALPTPSSAAVETELSEPVRTEKEIVFDLQTELNRVGCGAGTPDGVSGRKTRAAFSSFIKESGVDLSEGDLASEKAVTVLKAQEGTICKVRTMASTSASALAGNWGFRSDCPGFGNRIIRNTGSMNLAYQGDNTLRGPARNKQGNTGSAVVQFQGTRTAATIIKFGFVTLKGNLTRSNSNMTISGTGSNNCKIVAWKN